MKTMIKSLMLLVLFLVVNTLHAQQPEMQYFRDPGAKGLKDFEAPKTTDVKFDGVKVRVGGDFAIQMQGISQTNAFANSSDSAEMFMQLIELGTNFNLPSANLNIDVQLHNGLRLHMRNYLSSKHHPEAWVKGGYIQVDRLDFIKDGFMEGLMDKMRFKFGMDEINYGDVHFRRSDNARAIYNPFVGNYIMDAFTTEPFAEASVFVSGIIGVVGVTNGRLNQSPFPGDNGASFYAKLGYDNELNEDLRVRLTGSFYRSSINSTRDYLYAGDRAGSRYNNLLQDGSGRNNFTPRHNTGFASQTAFQINPFVSFMGIEALGVFEVATNNDDAVGGSFTQIGAELLYRFIDEKFYIGGRYNSVSGKYTNTASEFDITRLNIGGGWFMTNNVLAKVEYVSSSYGGDGLTATRFQGAEFNGVVLEAVISF